MVMVGVKEKEEKEKCPSTPYFYERNNKKGWGGSGLSEKTTGPLLKTLFAEVSKAFSRLAARHSPLFHSVYKPATVSSLRSTGQCTLQL